MKDLWIGKILGETQRYQLESFIGAGGMGRVYRAIDRKLSSFVAVKLMISSVGNSLANEERFKREMEVCVKLQNSRVVRVLDCGTAMDNFNEPVPFIIMEYITSPTLENILLGELNQHFSITRAVIIAIKIEHIYARNKRLSKEKKNI
jgi:serine/threonine-protein kinase